MTLWNPLEHPIVLSYPQRVQAGAWVEHVPFAMLAIDLVRPRVLVELGTHWGVSYCAFCQAVQQLGVEASCYAVDTWEGDPHTGVYGPEVLADLRAHHDPRYAGFSRLLRETFDAAAAHFADGSIDLLHIDGYHTYDAVRHDYETWQPKLSARGVVLFHDINVREYDFGVWRFWQELKPQYPHLEFHHGSGLGVVAVGAEPPGGLRSLLEMPPHHLPALRAFFSALGRRISLNIERDATRSQLVALLERQAEFKRLVAGWE
ncbi:MAG: hypothetical protein DCC58_13245 [Chloroflexi bacterium]|nr:MAG: hypothetical protein DCC58_13245 [Chloroflexota bacterium]